MADDRFATQKAIAKRKGLTFTPGVGFQKPGSSRVAKAKKAKRKEEEAEERGREVEESMAFGQDEENIKERLDVVSEQQKQKEETRERAREELAKSKEQREKELSEKAREVAKKNETARQLLSELQEIEKRRQKLSQFDVPLEKEIKAGMKGREAEIYKELGPLIGPASPFVRDPGREAVINVRLEKIRTPTLRPLYPEGSPQEIMERKRVDAVISATEKYGTVGGAGADLFYGAGAGLVTLPARANLFFQRAAMSFKESPVQTVVDPLGVGRSTRQMIAGAPEKIYGIKDFDVKQLAYSQPGKEILAKGGFANIGTAVFDLALFELGLRTAPKVLRFPGEEAKQVLRAVEKEGPAIIKGGPIYKTQTYKQLVRSPATIQLTRGPLEVVEVLGESKQAQLARKAIVPKETDTVLMGRAPRVQEYIVSGRGGQTSVVDVQKGISGGRQYKVITEVTPEGKLTTDVFRTTTRFTGMPRLRGPKRLKTIKDTIEPAVLFPETTTTSKTVKTAIGDDFIRETTRTTREARGIPQAFKGLATTGRITEFEVVKDFAQVAKPGRLTKIQDPGLIISGRQGTIFPRAFDFTGAVEQVGASERLAGRLKFAASKEATIIGTLEKKPASPIINPIFTKIGNTDLRKTFSLGRATSKPTLQELGLVGSAGRPRPGRAVLSSPEVVAGFRTTKKVPVELSLVDEPFEPFKLKLTRTLEEPATTIIDIPAEIRQTARVRRQKDIVIARRQPLGGLSFEQPIEQPPGFKLPEFKVQKDFIDTIVQGLKASRKIAKKERTGTIVGVLEYQPSFLKKDPIFAKIGQTDIRTEVTIRKRGQRGGGLLLPIGGLPISIPKTRVKVPRVKVTGPKPTSFRLFETAPTKAAISESLTTPRSALFTPIQIFSATTKTGPAKATRPETSQELERRRVVALGTVPVRDTARDTLLDKESAFRQATVPSFITDLERVQTQTPKTRTAQLSRTTTVFDSRTAQIPGFRVTTTQRTQLTPRTPTTTKVPKALLGTLDRPPKVRETKTSGYSTLIKERGRFTKANEKPLPKREALRLGADIVDNSASRTFKVKKGKTRVPASRRSRLATGGQFQKDKFRKKDSNYIEKTKFAIDSLGELQGITAKGLLAQRKARLF